MKLEEGPVRTITVTRKEVVPGWYGVVLVTDPGRVRIDTYTRDPDALRGAAATLIEIADALEGQT